MSDAPFVLLWLGPSLGSPFSFTLYRLPFFFFPHLYLFPHLKQRKGKERDARQHSPIQGLASGEMRVGFDLCYNQRFPELSRGSLSQVRVPGRRK